MKAKAALIVLLPALLALGMSTCSRNGHQGPSGCRVIVIGLDGANTGVLSPLLAQGRMPNLARFLERAAGGQLIAPVAEGWTSASLWTTLVTGFPPEEHGITDFVLPLPDRPDVLVPSASGHRRRPALWNMLDAASLKSGIVGLWCTWPAEHVEGAIVSDRVTYSRLRLSKNFRTQNGQLVPFPFETTARNVHPASLLYDVEKRVLLPHDIEPETLRRFADFSDEEIAELKKDREFGSFNVGTEPLPELKISLQSDRSYAAIADLVQREVDPALTWLYLEGIDVMEHSFWSHRAGLEAVKEPDRTRFRDVLDRYCEFTDELIKDFLAQASPDTVVIVVSDHGYATQPDHPNGHWHDQNSIFFAAGGPIVPRATLAAAGRPEDVTPTILALLGLPVAADMPGRVLEEILEPEFAARHRERTKDSYGTQPLGEVFESAAGDALMERLKQIGYLDSSGKRAAPPASQPAKPDKR